MGEQQMLMSADCVGGSKEDALHLWAECSATWGLGGRGACQGSYQMVNRSAQQVPQGANICRTAGP